MPRVPVPLRKFSQNWLANDELAEALVRAMEVRPGNHFLEIGPGEGRMTRALLRQGAMVAAVELDARCCAALEVVAEESLGRLLVIQGDILEFDPAGLGWPEMRLVGNLPYAIASPILRWTAKHHRRVIDAHYMVPADVAGRMLAPAGSADRGLLSVLVEWFFDGKVVRKLGPGAFRPPPRINSAFVHLTPHDPPSCAASGPHRRAVVQAAFAHRRKTMANSLRLSGWRRDDIVAALATAGIDERARAEEVELEQFARLAEALPELDG
jgi:16S rRNA (adenine1518-N6/adenine1519-N6)-dimethyltransferase